MMASSRKISLAIVICAAFLAGCATARKQPVIYRGLASASSLQTNLDDKDGHTPFLYSADDVDWHAYTHASIDGVVIYHGRDSQFGKISEPDKIELATYMQAKFEEMLKSRYAMTEGSGADALRIHLTLTGLETNTPFFASVSKVDPIGVLLNGIKTVRGKQAQFTGSVSYTVEVYDNESDRLLLAYVTKQFPWAIDVPASFGRLGAARAGVREGAIALLDQLPK